MKKVLLLFTILLSSCAYAKKVRICSDNNFWYPFTFVKDGIPTGVQIDVINQALINLNHEPEFVPLPWLRCLSEAEAGKFDGVATASYKDKRAVFLHYPEGAKSDAKSPWRVTQVEYVVINHIESDYVFTGEMKTIPQPVRIARGYSIIDTIKEQGLKVQTSAGAESNFKKLIRDKEGSIIDLADVAKFLESKYPNKYKIQEKPIKSKSYYFPTTKKGSLTLDESKSIWEEIKNVRENKEVMQKFYLKY